MTLVTQTTVLVEKEPDRPHTIGSTVRLAFVFAMMFPADYGSAGQKFGPNVELEAGAANASTTNIDAASGLARETQDDTNAKDTDDPSRKRPAEKALGDVTPLTVAEAKAIYDATQFPAPGGNAAESYSRPTAATFNISGEFPKVVAETVKVFENLNWPVIARQDSSENSVAFYVRNQQLLIACKVREERNSRTRMDVQALGNVDIRSIPKTDVTEVLYDYLDYVVYRTTASLDEIVPFYDRLLTEAGWQKFRRFDGRDENVSNRRFVQYRNRGVRLNVSADSRGGQILASLFCEMLEQDVPTPDSATELELDDHLFRQRFRSMQNVSELVKFFTSNMKQFGWTMPFGQQFEESKAGMLFTRPQGDPVYLELLSEPDGTTLAYMAGPTRQVTRAVENQFEVDYEKSLPLSQTQMHTVAYQSIPFNQPLSEGSGRTIAESVFFNTKLSLEENFDFYRSYLSKLGWKPGDRKDELIGVKLQRASVTFKKSDAEIVVSARPWVEDTNRVTIEGNGIQWPGSGFCHMMARKDEAKDIEWFVLADEPSGQGKLNDSDRKR